MQRMRVLRALTLHRYMPWHFSYVFIHLLEKDAQEFEWLALLFVTAMGIVAMLDMR